MKCEYMKKKKQHPYDDHEAVNTHRIEYRTQWPRPLMRIESPN
jgi:hypothetical protein